MEAGGAAGELNEGEEGGRCQSRAKEEGRSGGGGRMEESEVDEGDEEEDAREEEGRVVDIYVYA